MKKLSVIGSNDFRETSISALFHVKKAKGDRAHSRVLSGKVAFFKFNDPVSTDQYSAVNYNIFDILTWGGERK